MGWWINGKWKVIGGLMVSGSVVGGCNKTHSKTIVVYANLKFSYEGFRS